MKILKNDSSMYEEPLEISFFFFYSVIFTCWNLSQGRKKIVLYKDVYHSTIYNREKMEANKMYKNIHQ